MTTSTYIGLRGYTILKECMEEDEIKWLREKLTAKPYVPNSPIQQPSFKVYQETEKKIFIPRCFGIENYGEPEEYKIAQGLNLPIELKFNGELRDYQKNIVSTYINSSKNNRQVGLLEIPCGRGKTVIALNIISQLKTKTIVLVHKSFLLNQWVERIEQFLPGAKIGRIQGKIIDIEGKDIVIGMIQSLSMKEYPQNIFTCFGLTIVDECHHISSEVFSQTLQKVVTRCMLGLSATMERKDGLSYVFKMFLGDIVYSEKRNNNDDIVMIKGIEYISKNDSEFDETKYDYRGNPMFSSMITKLCSYNHRTEFILKIVEKELEIKKDQQIMILGHNRNLLTYLHDAIEKRNIASVGYYVGGMKEEELKKSETKKVIVATYSMAAEGLDIKTLSTLIFATPKTDVVQAVGRILRVKHERPLIIDIIDTHDIFKKQWYKRKSFYLKNNYNVMYTNNEGYFTDKWKQSNDKNKNKNKTSLCNIINNDDEEDNCQYNPYKNFTFGKCMIQL